MYTNSLASYRFKDFTGKYQRRTFHHAVSTPRARVRNGALLGLSPRFFGKDVIVQGFPTVKLFPLYGSGSKFQTPKRKREGNGTEAHSGILPSVTENDDSAKFTIRHISLLERGSMREILLEEDSTGHSFSTVQYEEIAPYVNLNPDRNMRDIPTFNLHRSRISTSLFKSIVQDLDILLLQYGPPREHHTEEATSRFLSPIFNHLIAQFGFAFRNLPQSTIKGSITTRGRIEYYFRVFGSISVIFIEVKLRIGSQGECLNAVAQVIAECEAYNLKNVDRGYSVPVYGILCDGQMFQFFSFSGSARPFSFSLGTLQVPGDPPSLTPLQEFKLDDFAISKNPRPFLRDLRQICEIIFDLLLKSYISSLEVNFSISISDGVKEGKKRASTDVWEQALSSAQNALEQFRGAEMRHLEQSPEDINLALQKASQALNYSINLIPTIDKTTFIMSGWDDEEVEKI